MTKKGKEGERYFAHLDIGAGVKFAGITFDKQGEPHAVPELWVEDFENSPVFAEVDGPDKTLSPAECAIKFKAEMKAHTDRRNAWRVELGKAKMKAAPAPAPPEPEPAPKPAPKPGAISTKEVKE